jgi:hypothetical protein
MSNLALCSFKAITSTGENIPSGCHTIIVPIKTKLKSISDIVDI